MNRQQDSGGAERRAGVTERRAGATEREEAARVLGEAVRHLMSERERGDQHSVGASREAIELLCAAARRVGLEERREGARRLLLGWLWEAAGWTR